MLHHNLLKVAEHLLAVSAEDAFLRRSISTAYYAVFHMLADEASNRFMPANPTGLRIQMSRAFSHKDMKAVCRKFASDQKSATTDLAHLLVYPIETEMRTVAEVFIALQEARHSADYDLSLTLQRSKVVPLVAQARQAFRAWSVVRTTPNATAFLAALLLNHAWNRPG